MPGNVFELHLMRILCGNIIVAAFFGQLSARWLRHEFISSEPDILVFPEVFDLPKIIEKKNWRITMSNPPHKLEEQLTGWKTRWMVIFHSLLLLLPRVFRIY